MNDNEPQEVQAVEIPIFQVEPPCDCPAEDVMTAAAVAAYPFVLSGKTMGLCVGGSMMVALTLAASFALWSGMEDRCATIMRQLADQLDAAKAKREGRVL